MIAYEKFGKEALEYFTDESLKKEFKDSLDIN